MNDYERGKRFASLLNKHSLDIFHLLQYILNLLVIPLFYMLFQMFQNNFATNDQRLFIGKYAVFWFSLHFILELLKNNYFKKTELTKLEEIFGAENSKRISIVYFLTFSIGIPTSKDFDRGLRNTYWYAKIYYPFLFIVVILIVIPIIIFMFTTLFSLFESIVIR